MAVSYAGAFYRLGFALMAMPVGVAYALWSGLGVVLITLIGVGVVVINVFSDTVSH